MSPPYKEFCSPSPAKDYSDESSIPCGSPTSSKSYTPSQSPWELPKEMCSKSGKETPESSSYSMANISPPLSSGSYRGNKWSPEYQTSDRGQSSLKQKRKNAGEQSFQSKDKQDAAHQSFVSQYEPDTSVKRKQLTQNEPTASLAQRPEQNTNQESAPPHFGCPESRSEDSANLHANGESMPNGIAGSTNAPADCGRASQAQGKSRAKWLRKSNERMAQNEHGNCSVSVSADEKLLQKAAQKTEMCLRSIFFDPDFRRVFDKLQCASLSIADEDHQGIMDELYVYLTESKENLVFDTLDREVSNKLAGNYPSLPITALHGEIAYFWTLISLSARCANSVQNRSKLDSLVSIAHERNLCSPAEIEAQLSKISIQRPQSPLLGSGDAEQSAASTQQQQVSSEERISGGPRLEASESAQTGPKVALSPSDINNLARQLSQSKIKSSYMKASETSQYLKSETMKRLLQMLNSNLTEKGIKSYSLEDIVAEFERRDQGQVIFCLSILVNQQLLSLN